MLASVEVHVLPAEGTLRVAHPDSGVWTSFGTSRANRRGDAARVGRRDFAKTLENSAFLVPATADLALCVSLCRAKTRVCAMNVGDSPRQRLRRPSCRNHEPGETPAFIGARAFGTAQAGARIINSAHARLVEYRPGQRGSLESFAAACGSEGYAPGRCAFGSFHIMGSARMGGSPQTSATRPDGTTWDLPNVVVADASCFPTASGVNPDDLDRIDCPHERPDARRHREPLTCLPLLGGVMAARDGRRRWSRSRASTERGVSLRSLRLSSWPGQCCARAASGRRGKRGTRWVRSSQGRDDHPGISGRRRANTVLAPFTLDRLPS